MVPGFVDVRQVSLSLAKEQTCDRSSYATSTADHDTPIEELNQFEALDLSLITCSWGHLDISMSREKATKISTSYLDKISMQTWQKQVDKVPTGADWSVSINTH